MSTESRVSRFPMPLVPDLDRAVATEIMGFELEAHGQPFTRAADGTAILWPGIVPLYSSDPVAARLMEEQLERLGLAEAYATALARRVSYDRTPLGAWRLLHASPRERCEAALEVWRNEHP